MSVRILCTVGWQYLLNNIRAVYHDRVDVLATWNLIHLEFEHDGTTDITDVLSRETIALFLLLWVVVMWFYHFDASKVIHSFTFKAWKVHIGIALLIRYHTFGEDSINDHNNCWLDRASFLQFVPQYSTVQGRHLMLSMITTVGLIQPPLQSAWLDLGEASHRS